MDNDLFIEPPWIQLATDELSNLRAAVLAQGLRWEKPRLEWSGGCWYATWHSEDGRVLRWYQVDHFFTLKRRSLYVDESPGVIEGDIIDLYRKWIERNEAKT